MFENIEYQAHGATYIISGSSPDLFEDFSHKLLFSIENKTQNKTFSYNIGIAHQLWALWQISESNEEKLSKVKEMYLEKVKRLIDAQKEEYTDLTMTPLNTPKDLDEALQSIKA
jgi:hypothetical protein